MSLPELFFVAVALSMDAFAVAVCKGLSMKQMNRKYTLLIGLYFGGFQALMPLIGYLLGIRFQKVILSWDHWIAFVLLCLIGGNMVKDSLESGEKSCDASVAFQDLAVLAVATSIDALAIGITFAFLQVRIVPAVWLIGAVTFVLSMAGVKAGTVFGTRYRSRAELAGGVILIAMGLKILLGHLLF